MHIHTHSRRSATYLLRESRLCRKEGAENLPDAYATVNAGREILANPDVREAMETYNKIIAVKYADKLQNPVDRANFYAFLLQGILPDRASAGTTAVRQRYSGFERNAVNVSDPFRLADRDDQAVIEAQNAWKERKEPDAAVLERTIQKFLEWKDRLNVLLHAHRIAPPTIQSVDVPGAKQFLSRTEYFELLVLVSAGKIDAIETAIVGSHEPGSVLRSIRSLLRQQDVRVLVERASTIHMDLLLDEMGPTEVLSRFGVVLGPYLRQRYLSLRRGAPTAPGQAPRAIADAALWEQEPMLAHAFLVQSDFPHLQGNAHFLEALQFYFDPNIPKDPDTQRIMTHGMKKDDVRAVLSLIVQSLLLSDQYLTRSVERREELKKELNMGQEAERHAREIWEYIKDFREHPLGSALMGLTAFLVARKAYRFFFKDEDYKITKLLGYAAIGGLAVGLYQKQKSGKAWWEGAKLTIDRALAREIKTDPKERTLANVWAAELKLDDAQKRHCLSILEEQPIHDVLAWYKRMDEWKRGGPKQNVQLPFSIQPYRNLFGEMGQEEIAELFYQTLKIFLAHRGRAARAGGWLLDDRNGMRDDAALGMDFLWKMFVERKHFYYLAMQIIRPLGIGDSVDILRDWEDPALQRQLRDVLPPDVYMRLATYRYIYVQESKAKDTMCWPMYYLFALQMDENMASRMGRDGATEAGVLQQLHFHAKLWTKDVDSWWKNLGRSSGPTIVGSGGPTTVPAGRPTSAPTPVPNPALPGSPASALPGGPTSVLPGAPTTLEPGRPTTVEPGLPTIVEPPVPTIVVPRGPTIVMAEMPTTVEINGVMTDLHPGIPEMIPPNMPTRVMPGVRFSFSASVPTTLDVAAPLSSDPSRPTEVQAGHSYALEAGIPSVLEASGPVTFITHAPMTVMAEEPLEILIDSVPTMLHPGIPESIPASRPFSILPGKRLTFSTPTPAVFDVL